MRKRNDHVIIWNGHTGRYEVWHESQNVAHSESLITAQRAFPKAVTTREAQTHHDEVEAR